jgi:hypothetical protein
VARPGGAAVPAEAKERRLPFLQTATTTSDDGSGAERSRAEEARGSTPSRGAKTHWLQAGQTYGDVGAPDVHGASRFFSYRCGAVQAEYAAQHDEARSERNMAWIDRCSWCNTDWPW